ncbi:hypothetical protein Salat_2774000 [Sesamum alatum]|uniref:Transposase (putative) gypsy type domain-containing protein n=1 Tax=Sesamum alatum TaxID=300844 RepID=A0AAE2C960_9LAMI|nr:hypothetical protein Salat_2774000 [Sesamum alatum]
MRFYPPPGCLTVYAAQCVSGLSFPLHPFLVELLVAIGIPLSQLNPNSYRLVVGFLLCRQLYHIENFLGLHPVPDTYTGLESRYFRLQNLLLNPPSSSSTRSTSATPLDIQSSGRGRSPSCTPSGVRPSSASPSLVPFTTHRYPHQGTYYRGGDFSRDGYDPCSILSPNRSSFGGRVQFPKEALYRGFFPRGGPSYCHYLGYSAPLFPSAGDDSSIRPQGWVSNMCKAVHRGDVESLASHPMEGLGHLLLSQTAMTPAIIVAMIERYDKMRANLEAVLSQLKGARSQAEVLKKKLADEESKYREEMSVLKAQSCTRGREEGLIVGQSTVVAAFKASPEFAKEVFRQGSSFYADGFTVCAELFKNLGNLPPDFDHNFLDMRADGFGRIGGAGHSES